MIKLKKYIIHYNLLLCKLNVKIKIISLKNGKTIREKSFRRLNTHVLSILSFIDFN